MKTSEASLIKIRPSPMLHHEHLHITILLFSFIVGYNIRTYRVIIPLYDLDMPFLICLPSVVGLLDCKYSCRPLIHGV